MVSRCIVPYPTNEWHADAYMVIAMHHNAERIDRFYRSLNEGKAEDMAAAYHPRASFSDPVFQLEAADIGDMWRMFTVPDSDLGVVHSSVHADDHTGGARWEAFYTFRPTGRAVHNVIDAQFEFEDGLILEHRDDFNLTGWAAQALGVSGILLGWTPWLQNRIRERAAKQLRRFQTRREGDLT